MSARQKVQAARTALVLDQPFFGVLSLRLEIYESTSHPAAWTDGKSLGYNPAFVESLTHDELVGLIAHEVMHCANGHPWRRDNRDPERANIAMDLAINPILKDAGFKLPAGALIEKQFHGKSFEWIYARLPQDPKGNGKGKGQGAVGAQQGQQGQPGGVGQRPGDNGKLPGAGGLDVVDAPPDGSDDSGATEADWQQAVQQAAAAAKARGNLPASLERFAKTAAEERVNWKSVLRRFVQSAAREDYSWTRPSTRYLARGLYLPSLRSEAMGPIAVAVDTSGSIDQVTLDQFAAEINAVASEMRPERVTVIYCDAKVNRIDTFERDDIITMTPCGGGGTAFAPVMDVVDVMDEQPVCLIYLTDLQGSHRPEPPAMPVLWATTQRGTAPYGEVVSMEKV